LREEEGEKKERKKRKMKGSEENCDA